MINIILLDIPGFESPLVENDDYKLSKDKNKLTEKEYIAKDTDFCKR